MYMCLDSISDKKNIIERSLYDGIQDGCHIVKHIWGFVLLSP